MMPWVWWAIIGADALFMVVLIWLLLKGLGGQAGGGGGVPAPDLSRFLKESKEITQEFDRLLAEKRDLVESTLRAIDTRIEELSAMEKRLADKKPPAPSLPPRSKPSAPAPAVAVSDPAEEVRGFREEVRRLAKAGKSAAAIAEATGHPRGEVELVLGLAESGV